MFTKLTRLEQKLSSIDLEDLQQLDVESPDAMYHRLLSGFEKKYGDLYRISDMLGEVREHLVLTLLLKIEVLSHPSRLSATAPNYLVERDILLNVCDTVRICLREPFELAPVQIEHLLIAIVRILSQQISIPLSTSALRLLVNVLNKHPGRMSTFLTRKVAGLECLARIIYFDHLDETFPSPLTSTASPYADAKGENSQSSPRTAGASTSADWERRVKLLHYCVRILYMIACASDMLRGHLQQRLDLLGVACIQRLALCLSNHQLHPNFMLPIQSSSSDMMDMRTALRLNMAIKEAVKHSNNNNSRHLSTSFSASAYGMNEHGDDDNSTVQLQHFPFSETNALLFEDLCHLLYALHCTSAQSASSASSSSSNKSSHTTFDTTRDRSHGKEVPLMCRLSTSLVNYLSLPAHEATAYSQVDPVTGGPTREDKDTPNNHHLNSNGSSPQKDLLRSTRAKSNVDSKDISGAGAKIDGLSEDDPDSALDNDNGSDILDLGAEDKLGDTLRRRSYSEKTASIDDIKVVLNIQHSSQPNANQHNASFGDLAEAKDDVYSRQRSVSGNNNDNKRDSDGKGEDKDHKYESKGDESTAAASALSSFPLRSEDDGEYVHLSAPSLLCVTLLVVLTLGPCHHNPPLLYMPQLLSEPAYLTVSHSGGRWLTQCEEGALQVLSLFVADEREISSSSGHPPHSNGKSSSSSNTNGAHSVLSCYAHRMLSTTTPTSPSTAVDNNNDVFVYGDTGRDHALDSLALLLALFLGGVSQSASSSSEKEYSIYSGGKYSKSPAHNHNKAGTAFISTSSPSSSSSTSSALSFVGIRAWYVQDAAYLEVCQWLEMLCAGRRAWLPESLVRLLAKVVLKTSTMTPHQTSQQQQQTVVSPASRSAKVMQHTAHSASSNQLLAGGSTLAPGERAALLLPIFTVLTSSVAALRAMQDAAADTANNHLDEDGSASLRQLSQNALHALKVRIFPTPFDPRIHKPPSNSHNNSASMKGRPVSSPQELAPTLDCPPHTLRHHLVAKMTSIEGEGQVSRCAAELLFALCHENKDEFVARTGFGNAIALLQLKGLLG